MIEFDPTHMPRLICFHCLFEACARDKYTNKIIQSQHFKNKSFIDFVYYYPFFIFISYSSDFNKWIESIKKIRIVQSFGDYIEHNFAYI